MQALFVLSKDVPPGSVLVFQTSAKRNNRGEFKLGDYSAELSDGTPLAMKPRQSKDTAYSLDIPKNGLKRGDKVIVKLVDCKPPNIRILNKFFLLYYEPAAGEDGHPPEWAGGDVWAGERCERIVATCSMHILGGGINHLRAYIGANAKPGEQMEILIRPEDVFGNLSQESPGDIAVYHEDQKLSADFEQIDGSTCILARVMIPDVDICRLKIVDNSSGKTTVTNPCKITKGHNIYWGMIHGHTEMSDGTGKLDQYFNQLKNEVALDFGATADHDHRWETPDGFWDVACETVKRWNQPGRFATLLGYEWAKWRKNGDGDRNVYYISDDRPIYRSDDEDYPRPPDLFRALDKNNEKAIVIPHHTGHRGNFCDWKDHDERFERLVEIFQIRGSYECSEEDGNPAPERIANTEPFPGGYVRNALAMGWRVGFTAGGDDHEGQWGTEARIFFSYKQGLMSVESIDLSRESIFDAMYNRRVVATSGARMLLTWNLNDKPMGSELSLRKHPELLSSRKLNIEFYGTDSVEKIDIIRNNTVAHSATFEGEMDVLMSWEDNDPLDGIWMPPAKYSPGPFAFYYVRVIQKDGEIAWASPIWIEP